jgi:hypothetical protein
MLRHVKSYSSFPRGKGTSALFQSSLKLRLVTLAMSDKIANLTPTAMPDLIWGPNNSADSLSKLSHYSLTEARRAIDWYVAKREPKKTVGRVLRIGAILATAVAGVIPVLSQIFEMDNHQPLIAPAWSTIALGIAALFIAVDRFWGFTSAWARFLIAEQALSEALTAFQIDWEASKLAWGGPEPSPEQAREMIGACKDFLAQVHKIVRQETNKWVTEFQSVTTQLNAEAKAAAKGRRGTGH